MTEALKGRRIHIGKKKKNSHPTTCIKKPTISSKNKSYRGTHT
jgi:hypothetical protein